MCLSVYLCLVAVAVDVVVVVDNICIVVLGNVCVVVELILIVDVVNDDDIDDTVIDNDVVCVDYDIVVGCYCCWLLRMVASVVVLLKVVVVVGSVCGCCWYI